VSIEVISYRRLEMRTIKATALLAVLALCACAAATQSNSSAQNKSADAPKATAAAVMPARDEADMAAIRPIIEETNRKMVETLKKGDLLGVSRFYTDDATMYFSRDRKIQGREALDKYWMGTKGAKDWKLEVRELGGDRETVYQIGRSTFISERDGKENTYACDFVVIWKRQADGSYRIYVDIYN
jgi:ketosteroid isomerase-like protein